MKALHVAGANLEELEGGGMYLGGSVVVGKALRTGAYLFLTGRF